MCAVDCYWWQKIRKLNGEVTSSGMILASSFMQIRQFVQTSFRGAKTGCYPKPVFVKDWKVTTSGWERSLHITFWGSDFIFVWMSWECKEKLKGRDRLERLSMVSRLISV
jgi:hypothetical protein